MSRRLFLALASPSVVVMLALMAVPLAAGFWLSLHGYTFRGELRWRGLDNYAETFADPDFWTAVGFTLLLCFVTVPASILLGFVEALLIAQMPRWLRGVVIACVLLPFVVTPVVGTLAFSWLFRDFGIVTYWLGLFGIRIYWLGSESTARTLVMLHWVWATSPFAAIVLFAGLQTVPPEQLEAAAVDGAGAWARMRHVTLPHLGSILVFIGIIMVMDAYRAFDSIAVMTKGVNGTESVMWYAYRVGILENNLTRGTAIGFLTVLGIVTLLLPFLWRTWREQRELSR
jgi:multiple sugar transport system permease protein